MNRPLLDASQLDRPGPPAPRRLASRRLAVCGWDHGTLALLRALADQADLRPIAIGDANAARLVRARAATGAASYQHLREMLRTTDYEAVLLQDVDAPGELAAIAADRGARVLLQGDLMDAAALRDTANAALEHGASLAVLRPRLRATALVEAIERCTEEAGWRPYSLSIEARGPEAPAQRLRDAIALALRMLPESPTHVVASACGPTSASGDGASELAAHLRYSGERLATVRVASDAAPRWQLEVASAAGRLAASVDETRSRLVVSDGNERGAPAVERTIEDGDLLALEAARVAPGLVADATDERLIHLEAATLGAIESALTTGQTHAIDDPTVRSSLRVLTGGASA